MELNATPKRNPPARRAGFSLAAMLLLTAVVAVLLAGLRPIVVDPSCVGPWQGAMGFCGAVVGTIVGAVLGVSSQKRVLGVLIGLPTGFVSGLLGGIVLSIPANLPLVAVGSVVIVAYAAVARAYSERGLSEEMRTGELEETGGSGAAEPAEPGVGGDASG